MVSVHDIDYYKTSKLFLTEDRKSGIAISPDGDIVSLFSGVLKDSRMEKLMLFALSNGGNKLDCFDAIEFKQRGLPTFIPVTVLKRYRLFHSTRNLLLMVGQKMQGNFQSFLWSITASP